MIERVQNFSNHTLEILINLSFHFLTLHITEFLFIIYYTYLLIYLVIKIES